MTVPTDESDIARVLTAAGARVQPPAELTAAVRESVHAEWRALLARQARHRKVVFALAAGLVLAVCGLWASRSLVAPRGESVATDSNHYTALAFPGGVSVRLDHDTRIERFNPQHIALRRGAVYVDAGAQHDARYGLQIDTPIGAVNHVGTQYEVRLLAAGTRIRVREGRVELGGRAPALLQAHDQLLVSASGLSARTSISPDSPEWDWASEAAPAFAINGRPLAEFLDWAGRELGREIVYSTPQARAEATQAILSGSIAGLTPGEALAAVLPTTRLRSAQSDGRIVIELQ